LNPTKQRAGQLGGLTTLALHGREHYQVMGLLGGRPRRLTYSEMKQQEAQRRRPIDKLGLRKDGRP